MNTQRVGNKLNQSGCIIYVPVFQAGEAQTVQGNDTPTANRLSNRLRVIPPDPPIMQDEERNRRREKSGKKE